MDNRVLDGLNDVMQNVFVDSELVITRDTTADDVDGWDSLSHARLIMEIERHFGIKFVMEEVGDLQNVGELVDLIERKLRQSR